MSRENPFDWVKDLNQSVEFVAESYEAKEFKKGVSVLLDADASPGSLVHCIVGDYGSGKSHINHHVFESAKKAENILVAYVSCKDLLDTVTEGRSLYGILLKEIIIQLAENAEDKISGIINEKFRLLSDDKQIEFLESKKKSAKTESEISGYEVSIKRLMQQSYLRKESFFEILDEIEESEDFKSKYKRIILVIDELEVLARPTRRSDLENIVALRENITKRSDVFWIFSCVFSSFEKLSQDTHSTDMFGQQGIAKAHYIPSYDKSDRKKMILSRMDNRASVIRSKKPIEELRFPFSTLKFGQRDKLRGGEITNMLSRPDLSPRVLMSICYDFFEDYNRGVESGKAYSEAYENARKALFDKHFFDLINSSKFKAIEKKFRHLITIRAPRAKYPITIENILKELFKIYLTKHSKTVRGWYGFDSENEHLQYVSGAIKKLLGTDVPGLSKRIAEMLKENCLEEIYNVKTEKTIWTFKTTDFQPVGKLPYLASKFHEYIDDRTEKEIVDSDLITELYKEFLDKEDRVFEEDGLKQTLNDLLETEKLEKSADSTNKFRVLDRKTESMESKFDEGIREIKKRDYKFSYMESYLKEKYFNPPLKNDNYRLPVSCKRLIGLERMESIEVKFWQTIPIDADERLLDNDFTLVIAGCSNNQIENSDLTLKKLDSDIFIKYRFEEKGHVAWILGANDDYIDDTGTITWRDILFFYNELNILANDCSLQEKIQSINTQVMSNSGNLKDKIRRRMMWNESKLYGFTFKELGNVYKKECLVMLSNLLKGSVEIKNPPDKRYADSLSEIYPWLTITQKIIAKNPNECISNIFGENLPTVVKDLVEIISEKPKTKEMIASAYFKRIGQREGVKGKPDKRAIQPVIYLVEALCSAFSDNFIDEGGKISVEGTGLSSDLSDSNLDWFFTTFSRKGGIEALLRNIDIRKPTHFASELGVCEEINGDYLKNPDILDEEISSPYDKTKKKKRELLARCNDWAKKSVINLSSKSKTFNKTLNDIEKDINEKQKYFEKIMAVKGLTNQFKNEIEESIPNEKLNLILKSVNQKQKEIKTIDILDKAGKNIDYEVWANYLNKKGNGFVAIDAIAQEIGDLNEEYQKIRQKSENSLNEFANKEISDINRFRTFVSTERLMAKFNKTKEVKALEKILNDLSNGVDHYDDEIKKIKKISELRGKLTEGQDIIANLCNSSIEDCYDGYHTMIDNYKKLAAKYSGEKKRKFIDKEFTDVIEHIDGEKTAFMNKIASSVKNYGDLSANAFEKPKEARERYEKKVGKATKKLLSKEHKRYLDDALKSINSSRLLGSLLEVKDESGEKELLSRLEFLKDMEEIGIITYNENQ